MNQMLINVVRSPNHMLLIEALRWALANGASWDPVLKQFSVIVNEESSTTRPIEPPAHLRPILIAVVDDQQ